MPSFASVVLVDRRGWLLLQERDEHAPIDPDTWGMSGGHVEPGEAAANRELLEETGLDLAPGTLWHHATLHVFHEVYGTHDPVHVYAAGLDLTDADVACREGRRMVFVDPATLGRLKLSRSASQALPALVGTDSHAQLRFEAFGRTRYACTALLDRRGWILLQERDENAPVAPEMWSLPGGGVEPGESYAEAALRELVEETSVHLAPEDLHRVGAFAIGASAEGPAADYEVWAAGVDLTDADVECHEGRRMVFVDPTLARALPLARATSAVLPDLLDSDLYRRLTA